MGLFRSSRSHSRSRRDNGPALPTHRDGSNRHGRREPGVVSKWRPHGVAMVSEFVGTVSFLWFALSGTQIANTLYTPEASATDAGPIFYIALSFGFSLIVNAWVFYRISGGLFNPAVTLGLCIAGGLPWLRGALLFFPQLLGGIVAAALVSAMFPGPEPVLTTLNHGTSIVQGLFIEMFLTFLLVITILMLAVEKSRATFVAPIGIGLALFVAELSGVYFTGGSLNPARSFGPSAVAHQFPGYHWIYWLGPVLGACMAAGFYHFVKFTNYEEVNPGQDAIDDREAATQEKRVQRRSSQRSR
ncbi:hypothetical protein MMC25_004820 [Agyrium rufum]|nr:hypothetical protein [Agyrium rufum]